MLRLANDHDFVASTAPCCHYRRSLKKRVKSLRTYLTHACVRHAMTCILRFTLCLDFSNALLKFSYALLMLLLRFNDCTIVNVRV